MHWLPAVYILGLLDLVRAEATPVITSPNGRGYVSKNDDDGFFRSILVDDSTQNAYIGAKNSIYKLDLTEPESFSKVGAPSNKESQPNFRVPETQAGTDYNIKSDVYKAVDDYLNKLQLTQLIATEKLSQVYKLKNDTFIEQCKRQIKILKLYYGKHLQLSLLDPDMVCAQHNKALTWLDKGDGKLFSLRNGLFGTMPVGLTGVTDFDKGWPVWLSKSGELALPGVSFTSFVNRVDDFQELIYNANRTCYKCKYSQVRGDCMYPGIDTDRNGISEICYREYGIPNYMATNYLCDSTPNPARLVTDVNNMEVVKDGPLPATARDSCPDTNIASTLLSGYHPDQTTKSISSASGNGLRQGAAIYVLAEIGQEKQLDVNHEGFMGYEEPIPLTSSSSLALVRLLVKDDDVSYDDIVVSNPFKETWVTSPLTKYGRLVKTGNQATVPHRPRAVGLFEDEDFIYYFFREVEWESMLQPEYTVNRYNFMWKSYDRTISYPWEIEKSESESNIKQFERGDPEMYFRHTVNTNPKFVDVKKYRNAHVYEPRLDAFKHGWQNSKLISRIGRVCKNDEGLPMGVQDASVFNLDNKLSMSAFQTLLKTKLTCEVKVNAVPRSWRLKKDIFNFMVERLSAIRTDNCGDNPCAGHSCYDNYTVSGQPNKGIFCDRNFKGRDVPFRAFFDYTTTKEDFINQYGLFQPAISGFTQYHWAYEKDISTFSSVSYEYTELKDMYKVGDTIYGIFSSPHSESVSPHSTLPAGSAICQFTMDDVKEAFNGPFKKRLNNTWRPFDPRIEGVAISPSPYTCDPDPIVREAGYIQQMEVEFSDETLPLERELQNFDLRGRSSRLNFFEKDVEGSRTMWNSVGAEPIYTSGDAQYEKIQAEKIGDVTLLYLSTKKGEIYKLATWSKGGSKNCWKPNATALEEWWRDQTNLHNNSWGHDYFNLTQESLTQGAKDFLFQSDWDCEKTTEYNMLAVYKPFDTDTTIWDMKLTKDKLVIGTNESVQIVYSAQCSNYLHCSTCSRDPHCGWNNITLTCSTFKDGLIQSIKSAADCSACLVKTKVYDPGEYVFLDTTLTLTQYSSLEKFNWYHNGTFVKERIGRFILTRNSSLYIMSGRPEDVGTWELRDSDNTCMITYNLSLSDCVTEECQYEKLRLNWCTEHDEWTDQMHIWQESMVNSNCVNSGNENT